jgi:hypothetical protein
MWRRPVAGGLGGGTLRALIPIMAATVISWIGVRGAFSKREANPGKEKEG